MFFVCVCVCVCLCLCVFEEMKRENFSKKKKRYFGDLLCLGRGDKDIIKKNWDLS